LFENGSCTYIDMILNTDISITHNPGGKRYKIANFAVMRHVAVNIGMEATPNPDIRRNCHKWTKNGSLCYRYFIKYDSIRCVDTPLRYTIVT